MKLYRQNGMLMGEFRNGVKAMFLDDRVAFHQDEQLVFVDRDELTEALAYVIDDDRERQPEPASRRGSIDDATPAEWDQAARRYYRS